MLKAIGRWVNACGCRWLEISSDPQRASCLRKHNFRIADNTPRPRRGLCFHLQIVDRLMLGDYSGTNLVDVRIRCVTIHTMPTERNESQLQKLRNARLWVTFASALLLPIAFWLSLNSTVRSARLYEVLGITSFSVLVSLWSPFKHNVISNCA